MRRSWVLLTLALLNPWTAAAEDVGEVFRHVNSSVVIVHANWQEPAVQGKTAKVREVGSGFLIPFVNYRMNSFGLSLIPFIMGIGFLFFNGKSLAGWLLTIAGLVIILAGILMSLHIYFQPTSLFNTLVMLVLLFGGLGLVFRSLKPVPKKQEPAG